MSLQPGPDDPTADSSSAPPTDAVGAGPDQGAGAPASEAVPTAPPPSGAAPPPPPPPPGGYGAVPNTGGQTPPDASWAAAPTASAPGYRPGPGWDAPPPPAGPPPGPAMPPPAASFGMSPGQGAIQPGPPGGYPPGQPGAYPAPRQTESKAVVGLVLAIVSWLLCPIVLAVAALIIAGQSNRAIDASGGQLDGRSLNTATKWVAWINIVLYGLALIAGLFLLGWILTQPDLINEITVDSGTQF